MYWQRIWPKKKSKPKLTQCLVNRKSEPNESWHQIWLQFRKSKCCGCRETLSPPDTVNPLAKSHSLADQIGFESKQSPIHYKKHFVEQREKTIIWGNISTFLGGNRTPDRIASRIHLSLSLPLLWFSQHKATHTTLARNSSSRMCFYSFRTQNTRLSCHIGGRS